MALPKKTIEAYREEDRKLVLLFLARNEQAISHAAERYGRALHGIAYRILKDEGASEECVNDTYLSAWNHIPPDEPDNLFAYLSKIVRNRALDRYRAESRKKRIPSEYTSSLEELEEVVGTSESTEEAYEGIRLQEVLNHFLIKLPKRKRQMFIWRYYLNDSAAEIAAMLKVSESTVFKELSGIRKELKEELIKEGFTV
ncbi:MAG: RNA polymerase sigma factor [Lachnospiraceae bacterium]|nr:RNA polymerase sigma factor [Lachnospiraceae bacterium]